MEEARGRLRAAVDGLRTEEGRLAGLRAAWRDAEARSRTAGHGPSLDGLQRAARWRARGRSVAEAARAHVEDQRARTAAAAGRTDRARLDLERAEAGRDAAARRATAWRVAREARVEAALEAEADERATARWRRRGARRG